MFLVDYLDCLVKLTLWIKMVLQCFQFIIWIIYIYRLPFKKNVFAIYVYLASIVYLKTQNNLHIRGHRLVQILESIRATNEHFLLLSGVGRIDYTHNGLGHHSYRWWYHDSAKWVSRIASIYVDSAMAAIIRKGTGFASIY